MPRIDSRLRVSRQAIKETRIITSVKDGRRAMISARPRVVAIGLFALDIVFGREDPSPRHYAGGTCGNVVAGLAHLGWDASALARLSDDVGGEHVRNDLDRWGVDTTFLGLAPTAETPIVLERISLSKNGVPKHRFLWNCPDCNSYFPAFKPVLLSQVERLKGKVQTPQVFFSDRVSRSTIELAKHFRKKGSLIFFEPSAAGDGKLFREMLGVCDVLKYSAQRARSFSELLRHHNAFLEIETLGEDGLRFRTRRAFGSWHSVPAYEVKIRDTAGSGDWTSVGLISTLFAQGRGNLDTKTKRDITSSLEHAQALAALNCQFEGPRAAMYRMTKDSFVNAVARLRAKKPEQWPPDKISLVDHESTRAVCPNCTKRYDHRSHRQSARSKAPRYSADAYV